MTPRVLHVSTYAGNGGAGRAAASLHRAMVGRGIDSTLLTGQGTRFRIASELDRRLWRLQRSPRVTWRSPARFGSVTASAINSMPVDVVNLHWVTDGLLSIEEIGRITKPVVWTMHDMWPFTGTEHYTSMATRWTEGYTSTNRPDDESGWDLDRWAWERKRRSWSTPPHLVPVSTWLADLAGRSALARDWPSTVIPNVMPTETFTPADRDEARATAGLPRDVPLVAFTASAGIHDERKGWQHLRDALPFVQERFADVSIMVIGPHSPDDRPGTTAPILWQGEIHDDARMAALLAAADVVAVPSEMDNLPMTACEAQSAGRAVVAFDVGGLPDIVGHQATGYRARPYDPQDFARGLIEAIEDARGEQVWGRAAREHATATWSSRVVVDEYLALYSTLAR